MAIDRNVAIELRNETFLGAWLGLLVLGVGGRAVMRGIALATDAPSAVSVGGTVTVVALGAAAGIGGALLHALSRGIASRFAHGHAAVRVVLFGALLALVTARGLHGSPSGPATAFWPLVVVYGAVLEWLVARRVNAGVRTRVAEVPA